MEVDKWTIINGDEVECFVDELDFEASLIGLVKSNDTLNLQMEVKNGQFTVRCV